MKGYPELVVRLVNSCSGWIFGSACVQESPRDYDVFIPLPFWRQASMLIPKDAKINRMGGFKCISEGKEVDVWTGEMHELLASNFFNCAYHPLTGIKIKRIIA
jgi:hypothetical protein